MLGMWDSGQDAADAAVKTSKQAITSAQAEGLQAAKDAAELAAAAKQRAEALALAAKAEAAAAAAMPGDALADVRSGLEEAKRERDAARAVKS